MKKQVVVIHGGDTFETYDEYVAFLKSFLIESVDYFNRWRWKDSLQEKLGDDFEVIAPKMPNKWNAKYSEWKIWFDKLVPFLNDNVIFVGHSLGGIFLAKYLSENKFPKIIKATFLVAAPYDAVDSEYTLADFVLLNDLKLFQKQGGRIFLFQSKDDPVVPFADLEKYKKQLPTAECVVFEDRGHFGQEEFPELVEMIKSQLI